LLSLEAIAQGIAVLVEKPLSVTPAEAERIVAAAGVPGAPPVQVGHVERFNPAVLELGRCLGDGWLSEVIAISSQRLGPYPERITDVGVTVDLATHDLDILCWITGERPDRVLAETARRAHANHEDVMSGTLFFPTGAIGSLDVGWTASERRRRLWVTGEEGRFELDYLGQRLTFDPSKTGPMPGPSSRRSGGLEDLVEIPVASGDPLTAELEAFIAVVRDGSEPVVGVDDGRWAVVLADALLTSAREGRSVDIRIDLHPTAHTPRQGHRRGGSRPCASARYRRRGGAAGAG